MNAIALEKAEEIANLNRALQASRESVKRYQEELLQQATYSQIVLLLLTVIEQGMKLYDADQKNSERRLKKIRGGMEGENDLLKILEGKCQATEEKMKCVNETLSELKSDRTALKDMRDGQAMQIKMIESYTRGQKVQIQHQGKRMNEYMAKLADAEKVSFYQMILCLS